MPQINIQLNIPESIRMSPFEAKMLIASRLFEEGHLSSGQAAEMVGISKRTFVELVGQAPYSVSILGYDAEDIEKDIANA